MRKLGLMLFAVAGVVVLFAGWYIFRVETIDGGEKGRLLARYRWGVLRTIEYDTNRDGQSDWWDDLSPGASLEFPETWRPVLSSIDVDYDGVIDIEWEVRTRHGVTARVYWVDNDGNGALDEVLFGEEGRQHLVRLLEQRRAVVD